MCIAIMMKGIRRSFEHRFLHMHYRAITPSARYWKAVGHSSWNMQHYGSSLQDQVTSGPELSVAVQADINRTDHCESVVDLPESTVNSTFWPWRKLRLGNLAYYRVCIWYLIGKPEPGPGPGGCGNTCGSQT